jgi:serine/threonine protein kinase/Flp pilus assembly protein TadD
MSLVGRAPEMSSEDSTVPFGPSQGNRADAPPPASSWGSFRLLARVGEGGFGEVYRAWDPHLQREVALKLLLPGAVTGEAEYEAMLREARAMASVHHPNIVPVYGIDRQNGRVGFWTDFVHGKTLATLLRTQGKFGAREAASIGLDVAKALSAVHRAGLLHRDIKAENVMREEGGRILLMDFGLSSGGKHQTFVAGTPNYMAPELFRGAQNTIATDMYALGVLLYYLVAGEYPASLSGLSASEVLSRLEQRKPLADMRPDLPDSLLRTITTAIDLDPIKRFASAGQIVSALAESLGASPLAEFVTPPSNDLPKGRRRVKILGGIAIVAALAAGFAAWRGFLPQRFRTNSEPTSVSSGTTYDQFQKAQDLLLRSYKQSNVAGAVKGFQEVLAADPSFALAHARLGLAYFIQYRNSHDPKLLDMAQQSTGRAMNLDPNLAPPYITLSRIAATQGQTALAMQQAQKALSLDPRSAEAYGALAEVYAAQGKDQDAIGAYQKAIDLAPDDWRWPVRLGNEEIGNGNLKDSIAQFQRGVDLAQDNAIAYYDLGVADMQADQMDEARKNLETALKIEPTANGYSALGSVFLLNHQYERAAEMYRRSIDLNPASYNAWGNLALAYSWSGELLEKSESAYRKAIALAEAEHEKNRDDPELLVALADFYASIGNSGAANPLLRQALALAPDNLYVAYEAGETYEALGQRDKAIPLIARAVANGYHAYEVERNPDLAALRADPAFATALHGAGKKK